MRIRRLRLLAALLPASLLLHEATYAFSGGADGAAHGYLDIALPVLVAAAISMALASLLLPLLGAGRTDRREGMAPLAVTGALIAIFVSQELIEALLLGGGIQSFAASMASSWLLLPIALFLGLGVTAAVIGLDRTELLLLAARARATARRPRDRARFRLCPPALIPPLSPLAFGLARRPPPRPIVH